MHLIQAVAGTVEPKLMVLRKAAGFGFPRPGNIPVKVWDGGDGQGLRADENGFGRHLPHWEGKQPQIIADPRPRHRDDDAAAVLRGLNRAFGNRFGVERLEELGAEVGSDVAFCVRGGTMLARGRGELLTPLPPLPDCVFVICKPQFSISTPELFRKLDQVSLRRHPDTAGIVSALERANLGDICRRMYNVFEDVNDRRMRTVTAIKNVLIDHGALGAVMTGTGSAVFGIFTDKAAAEAARDELKKDYGFCCLAGGVRALT